MVAIVDGHEGEEALHPPGAVRLTVLESSTGKRIAELPTERYAPERQSDALELADFDGDGVDEIVHRMAHEDPLLSSRVVEVMRVEGNNISAALRLYESLVDQHIPHLGTLRCAADIRVEPAGGRAHKLVAKGTIHGEDAHPGRVRCVEGRREFTMVGGIFR